MNGDYLINAQGEDVVNGSRPTKRIEETLGNDMPDAYKELVEVGKKLEKHYRNMQDIEFTISATSSTCCKRAMPSEPGSRQCGSQRTWSRKG